MMALAHSKPLDPAIGVQAVVVPNHAPEGFGAIPAGGNLHRKTSGITENGFEFGLGARGKRGDGGRIGCAEGKHAAGTQHAGDAAQKSVAPAQGNGGEGIAGQDGERETPAGQGKMVKIGLDCTQGQTVGASAQESEHRGVKIHPDYASACGGQRKGYPAGAAPQREDWPLGLLRQPSPEGQIFGKRAVVRVVKVRREGCSCIFFQNLRLFASFFYKEIILRLCFQKNNPFRPASP